MKSVSFIICFYAVATTALVRPNKPSFQIVEYEPDLEEEGDQNNSESESNAVEDIALEPIRPSNFVFKSTSEFIKDKNEFRAESYAKATLAGIKDTRTEAFAEIQVGFTNDTALMTNSSMNRTPASNKKLVCFYNVPTMYDQPFPVFPEQIDPFLCTHLILGSARVWNYSLVPNDLQDLEFYNRTIGLKTRNPNLKVMLSIAGTSSLNVTDTGDLQGMMMSNVSRGRFIRDAVRFLKQYGFDGLDMNWEFPGMDGPLIQKQHLIEFLAEFKSYTLSLNQNGNYILSATVPAIKYIVDVGFDVAGISRAVDFVNLMTYDFHPYSWLSPVTGPNSPLFNLTTELGFFATLNTAWASKYWLQNGMPKEKIMIGIPTYGRSFRLVDERKHGFYDLAMGTGSIGTGGFVPHVQICDFLDLNSTSVVFDTDAKEPYAYNGRDWLSFDNQGSAHEKAQFVRDMDFGGIMVYSLNSDDAWKSCKTSSTKFPIIQTAKNTLFT